MNLPLINKKVGKKSQQFKINTLFETDAFKLIDYGLADLAIDSREIRGQLNGYIDEINWLLDWVDELDIDVSDVLLIGARCGGKALKLANQFETVEALEWRPRYFSDAEQIMCASTLYVPSELGDSITFRLDPSFCRRIDFHFTDPEKLHPDYLNQKVVILSELPEGVRVPQWIEKNIERGLLKEDGLLMILNKFDKRRLAKKLDLIGETEFLDIQPCRGDLFELVEKEASLWLL